MKVNKVIAIIIIGTVVIVNLLFVVRLFSPKITDVATGTTPQYPDLQPQRFKKDYDAVFDAAIAVTKSMSLDILNESKKDGIIDAVAVHGINKAKDDVTITITREGEEVKVNIRSRSRAGKRDGGRNATRIRAIQSKLSLALGAHAALKFGVHFQVTIIWT